MSDAGETACIRVASPADHPTILALSKRLSEFGPPPWRNAREIQAVDRTALASALDGAPGDDAITYVALIDGAVAGFIHIKTIADYYTQRSNAHISDVVVDPAFAGRGIGSQLLQKAEEWARERGDAWISLSVFPQNSRAVSLYERRGFAPDIAKLIKPLR